MPEPDETTEPTTEPTSAAPDATDESLLTWRRVKDDASGHEHSIPPGRPVYVGETLLADKDAVDALGNPLPAKPNVNMARRKAGDASTDAEQIEQTEVPPYEEWAKADLQTELEQRGLPKSGTVAELAERLRVHDDETTEPTTTTSTTGTPESAAAATTKEK